MEKDEFTFVTDGQKLYFSNGVFDLLPILTSETWGTCRSERIRYFLEKVTWRAAALVERVMKNRAEEYVAGLDGSDPVHVWRHARNLEVARQVEETRKIIRKHDLTGLWSKLNDDDVEPWPEAGFLYDKSQAKDLRERLLHLAHWPRECRLCASYMREGERLVLDHDHDAMYTRGFICNRCNALLGVVEGKGRKLRGTKYDVWAQAAERYIIIAAEGHRRHREGMINA